MITKILKQNYLSLSIGLSVSCLSIANAGEVVFYGGGSIESPSFAATSFDSALLDSASILDDGVAGLAPFD